MKAEQRPARHQPTTTMTDAFAWLDPYQTARTYNGLPIAHVEILVRYWIGGNGNVFQPMIKCWNPLSPDGWIVHTPAVFEAITEPAN